MAPLITLATAAADKSSRLFAEVLPWLILLVGVIIGGGLIIFMARRYVHSSSAGQSGGFTLHDLRQLHEAGELNDEEFERAKAQMIGRLKSSAAKPASSADDRSSPGNQPSK
jgi:hypothetical protein